MKKISFTLALLSLFYLPLFAEAKDPVTIDTKKPLIQYHNRMAVFLPWHQVYERIKPNAFYVGIEAWLVSADALGSVNKSVYSLPDKHGWTDIGEIEIRMGYNFLSKGKDHLTPFAGGGFFEDYSEKHIHTVYYSSSTIWEADKHIRYSWIGYGTVGFLYDHEFNSVFNLGLNLKGMIGGDVSSEKIKWGNTVFGVDAALPITFRCGYKRHWDIRLEPFFIYLHGSEVARSYLGGRSTVGYRF